MIRQIELANFRAFRDSQTADLAPLTLIYGPNSSGKSTLVRSLLLLQQSVLFGNSPLPMMKGPLVDLGSTRVVVHGHRGTASIKVALTDAENSLFKDFEIEFELDANGAENEKIIINLHKDNLNLRLAFDRYGPNFEHLTIAKESISQFYSLESSLTKDGAIPLFFDEPKRLPIFSIDALMPSTVIGQHENGRKIQKFELNNLTQAEKFWSEISSQLIQSFRKNLENLSYLGPLRKPWERIEGINQDPLTRGVGVKGQNALTLLANSPEILNRVNDDLHRQLETNYRLHIEQLSQTLSENSVLEVIPPSAIPILEHRTSGVRISPVDAGFGLSQLLPIVIELNVRRHTLICIEQPELHLHPRLQARVGQLLRNAVMGNRGNRFFIETHSEHLLLRIQRLVRDGLLPSEQVCILYVDNQEFDPSVNEFVTTSESTIQKIQLDESGNLTDPWPGGFFEERLTELPGWSNDVQPIKNLSDVADSDLF